MNANTRRISLLAACLVPLLLIGCSESPAPSAKKEPEKPPEPVTGQSALFKMYQKARTWAPDAQVLKMNSMNVSGITAPPGKAGAWQATFTSANQGKMATYTYSVVEQEDVHKGVFPVGGSSSFSGSEGVDKPFEIQAVSVDSDAAYKTADEKAAEYDKQHPGMPITFQLERTNKYNVPTWRVIWGESVGTSNFSIYVDAMTGKFLDKMH
ncbi:MAG TPA: hypothetical protein VMB03_29000 [Bryobacteraceae bacterium]|nr:hypothetical protein [Bryobacteraceae bacterium]